METRCMKARHEFDSDEEYQKYLRTYFAAMAMQGILANTNRTESYEDATIFSVGYADALINELNK